MLQIQNFLTEYWGLISLFVGGICYAITHYKLALSFAKNKAIVLMLSAEANSEKLALTTGQTKFSWVLNHGYDLLPSVVRLVISKPTFSIIVQDLFDKALAFAKAHEVVIVPTVSPSTPTP